MQFRYIYEFQCREGKGGEGRGEREKGRKMKREKGRKGESEKGRKGEREKEKDAATLHNKNV